MSSIDAGHDADARDFAYQKLSDVEDVPSALPMTEQVAGEENLIREIQNSVVGTSQKIQ